MSLTKVLLFKKEIKPTDHLAFLFLDKNSGCICFIDQGIPQFVRNFQVNTPNSSGALEESEESLSLKILNEVANSFDFYSRQFNEEKIDQMIVSSSFDRQGLFDALAQELKVNMKKVSLLVQTVAGAAPVNNMEAIYAFGAGVDVPLEALSAFDFLAEKKGPQSGMASIIEAKLKEFQDVVLTFLLCAFFLGGVYVFFQTELKNAQKKYDGLAAQQGTFKYETVESLQSRIQESANTLSDYKDINIKSDVASTLLRVASLMPQGAWLQDFKIEYAGKGVKNTHLSMDINGYLFKDNLNEQMADVNVLVSAFKNDKVLAKFISNVNLISLKKDKIDDHEVTSFVIHCS